MSKGSNGKLLVYASSHASCGPRLRSVSVAAEKTAKSLDLEVEVVTFGEDFVPIYVYYKNGDREPIPIYCHKGRKINLQSIHKALMNMMFVLSFHPSHSDLRKDREEVMLFS